MQYVMLIYQGTTPLPGTDSWASLSEEEQKHVYADYGALNATPGVTPGLPLGLPVNATTVRVAGTVITRQRPGTAKGFVFLTLEDETGIANVIVRPDLFLEQRSVIVRAPYLLVEGTLQIQDGVTSIKAERMQALATGGPEPQSHDFR